MPGKVFISCGQANPKEKEVAKKLEDWLRTEGFSPYVAIRTQSINDVNSGIIGNLKNSDYYIFIDFRREKISCFKKIYRGSLFTNQELAIAYYLGFDNAIFFQQTGVKRDGLLNYMISNSTLFNDHTDVFNHVIEAVKARNWSPKYSRHLIASNLIWTKNIQYNDHSGNLYTGKVLNLDIKNLRNDLPAFKSQIRLEYIQYNGNTILSPDKSPIKCSGQPGFEQAIWPDSHCAFSLLLQDSNNPGNIYLLSSLDISPKQPIITAAGTYLLYFSLLAENFPLLNISIELVHNGYIHEDAYVTISNSI